MHMCGDAVDWNGINNDAAKGVEGIYLVGLEDKLPSGVLLSTVEGLAGYMR